MIRTLTARRPVLALLAAALLLPGAALGQTADTPFSPLSITHSLGTIELGERPARIAALDMNELDFLDQLGVPVAGTAKDYVPHFLAKYRDDPAVADLGFIVKPNLEQVYALRPDLILITSLQAEHYAEMSRLAPVIHFDVDYRDSNASHIDTVLEHFRLLARIFGKEALAETRIAALEEGLAELRALTTSRPERALILMHNNGAFSVFGQRSRYGFVFEAFGVKAANEAVETGLHGRQITSEFIHATDPEILYIIDRTAVMDRQPVLDAESIGNPLLRETKAWKDGKIVFVDPEAWYVTGASITSLGIMMADVARGYQD